MIDDDSQVRDALREMLELAGHQVDEAIEGGAGLALYKTHRHDLVITDIVMPGTEGIETIRLLVQEFPSVKIIAVSEGGHLGATENYLNIASIFGAKRVFEKPIDALAISEAVSQLLENQDTLRPARTPAAAHIDMGVDDGSV